MAKFNFPLACLLAIFISNTCFSQNDSSQNNNSAAPNYSATPPSMWEIGIHSGVFSDFSDINIQPGFGVGGHLRKAIDYVFSIRGEGFFGQLNAEDTQNGESQTTFFAISFQLLASINNLKWNSVGTRKVNLYALGGLGINNFKVEVNPKKIFNPNLKRVPYKIQTDAEVGAGIAFRISDRFNIGVESKMMIPFGNKADKLDGLDQDDNDVLNYSSVRLNFNIGNKEKLSEPLYWVNPMDVIMNDISELKKRSTLDFTDEDDDGVIDLIDQELSTPEGAAVDTRGVTLDSDEDGVPDYKDSEPYSPPGYSVDENGVSKAFTTPEGKRYATEEDVQRIVDDALSNFKTAGGGGSSSLADWFLPMIHFRVDSYAIREADYGHLANIANVLKSNPGIQVVVLGYTDKTASTPYNDLLSYNRAKAAVDHLVKIHHIPRNRLILNYGGEKDALVPTTGSSLMNRRVEFKVATGQELDMAAPKGAKTFSGNKDAGY